MIFGMEVRCVNFECASVAVKIPALSGKEANMMSNTPSLRQEFIAFSVKTGVLRFGEFTTKAGRQSPYFFNAGLFHEGATLGQAGQFLRPDPARFRGRIRHAVRPGPTRASRWPRPRRWRWPARAADTSFAFNRKEAKDHGEGGTIVGAKLQGKVVIIDDVISAGTSVRESVDMIRAAGAEPCAVLIALDRMERGAKDGVMSELSAVQEVTQKYGISRHLDRQPERLVQLPGRRCGPIRHWPSTRMPWRPTARPTALQHKAV